MRRKSLPPGIRVRHSRGCDRDKCRCKTFEASVFSKTDGRKIRKTFTNLSEAKTWRQDALVGVRKHTLRAPSQETVREAWAAWLAGAKAGTIRNRSGDPYKPSALRSYEQAMTNHVLDDFGALKLTDVQRVQVQDLADRLLADGLDPSTVRNVVMPLRALYRRALTRNRVAVNPTAGLELPASRGRRDRIVSAGDAASLLGALPESDRALWAVAFYAGLRRGELMGLRWEDVDLQAGLIHVERGYDDKAHVFVAPKSNAGVRAVPIVALLRGYLLAHRLRSGRSKGLVFGETAETPLDYWRAMGRAERAWKEAALNRVGLHEARHTAASLMIAARVNVKAISAYMGHSSITVTLDRYGHLLPGSDAEAIGLLDRFLDETGAQTGAHLAQTLQPSRI